MASGVGLVDIKSHFRVDHDSEDAIIQNYLASAEAYVATYLRRDMATDYPGGWPFEADQAVRMLACYWFENRSIAADGADAKILSQVKGYLSGLRCLS